MDNKEGWLNPEAAENYARTVDLMSTSKERNTVNYFEACNRIRFLEILK